MFGLLLFSYGSGEFIVFKIVVHAKMCVDRMVKCRAWSDKNPVVGRNEEQPGDTPCNQLPVSGRGPLFWPFMDLKFFNMRFVGFFCFLSM